MLVLASVLESKSEIDAGKSDLRYNLFSYNCGSWVESMLKTRTYNLPYPTHLNTGTGSSSARFRLKLDLKKGGVSLSASYKFDSLSDLIPFFKR